MCRYIVELLEKQCRLVTDIMKALKVGFSIWLETAATFHNLNHLVETFKVDVSSISGFETSSLAKGYDLLDSFSPLASDRFSRSHGDGLYVMQLVVAATNQNALYKKHMFCRKNVNKIKMDEICRICHKLFTNLRLKISRIIISSQFSGHSNERKWKPCIDWLKMTSLQGA